MLELIQPKALKFSNTFPILTRDIPLAPDAASDLEDLGLDPLDEEVAEAAEAESFEVLPPATDLPAEGAAQPALPSQPKEPHASEPLPAVAADSALPLDAPPRAPDAGQPVWNRHTNLSSYRWGHFYFTWSPPEKRPPHGSWQARCPYHRLNEKTACTKSYGLRNPDQIEHCRLVLQNWCIQARAYSRKRDHGSVSLHAMELLPVGLLEARLLELPVPHMVKTDAELDALDAVSAAAPPVLDTADAAVAASASSGVAAPAPASGRPAPSGPTLSSRKRGRTEQQPGRTGARGRGRGRNAARGGHSAAAVETEAQGDASSSDASSSSTSSSGSSDDSDSD